jgi:hypothetical protein
MKNNNPKAYCFWLNPLWLVLVGVFTTACIEERSPQPVEQVTSVSRKLEQMVEQDQRLRADDTLDYSVVHETDQRHRRVVFELLAAGAIKRAEDLFNAALILQHADPAACLECYLLAHYLALEASRQGFEDARYLVAATLDRYLVMSKDRQKFGTQFNIDSIGRYYLFPVDTAITDSERAVWNVPPLDSLKLRLDELNQP